VSDRIERMAKADRMGRRGGGERQEYEQQSEMTHDRRDRSRRARLDPRGAARRLCHTVRPLMPKMKTHSGAKKRFKLTAKGKVKARHAMTSHILEKKNAKRKRRLGNPVVLAKQDEARAKKLLGVGK
jgi:large subunit ribosomal protein L35